MTRPLCSDGVVLELSVNVVVMIYLRLKQRFINRID